MVVHNLVISQGFYTGSSPINGMPVLNEKLSSIFTGLIPGVLHLKILFFPSLFGGFYPASPGLITKTTYLKTNHREEDQ